MRISPCTWNDWENFSRYMVCAPSYKCIHLHCSILYDLAHILFRFLIASMGFEVNDTTDVVCVCVWGGGGYKKTKKQNKNKGPVGYSSVLPQVLDLKISVFIW